MTAAASCCFWRLQGSNTWHRPHGKLAGHKGWRQSEHLNKCVIPLRRVTFIICSSSLFSTASPLFSSSAIFALDHGTAAKSDSELEQNAPSYLITIRYLSIRYVCCHRKVITLRKHRECSLFQHRGNGLLISATPEIEVVRTENESAWKINRWSLTWWLI